MKYTYTSTMKAFMLIFFLVVTASCENQPQNGEGDNKQPRHEVESESRTNEDTSATANEDEKETATNEKLIQTPLHKYKYLFTQHRTTQLEAVKRIVTFNDNTKQYDLVNMMLKQIFKTVEEAKQNVTVWGYLPGDPFPENITVLEAVTKILENTALFGDMVLRLPDVVHDLYDRKKEWQLLLAWSYGFCMQSDVFEGPNQQLLSLMAQEVNIIPQDPKYFNPFKAANQEKMKQGQGQQDHPKKPLKKKPKKKLQRGPRMSHTEL